MPHFTLSFDPVGGPLITVVVGLSEPRAKALADANQPIPQGIPLRGLVDTGASGTCVETSLLLGLGLTPTGNIECHSPTTGVAPEKKDVYDISLEIWAGQNDPRLYFSTLPVMATDLFAAQGIHALVGRDVLRHCLLAYNGTTGSFTLAF